MLSNSSRSASIFEKSRMSLMMVIRCSPDNRAVSANSRTSASNGDSRMSPIMPKMPFIGVRISWLMLAKNALLARLAFSAASLASRSETSSFRRSDKSRTMASRRLSGNNLAIISTWIVLPSLRRNWRSPNNVCPSRYRRMRSLSAERSSFAKRSPMVLPSSSAREKPTKLHATGFAST